MSAAKWQFIDLHFRDFVQLPGVTRIYINELSPLENASLPVKLLKLITEPEATAPDLATELADQARVEISDLAVRENLINLLETIIVYKLPHKSREEIAAMLRMSNLKETKFYQEVFTEGMQEAQRIFIQRLVARGTIVAEILKLWICLWRKWRQSLLNLLKLNRGNKINRSDVENK